MQWGTVVGKALSGRVIKSLPVSNQLKVQVYDPGSLNTLHVSCAV